MSDLVAVNVSKGPENRFIGRIHRRIPKDKPYWEKMHNPYRGGTFDVWYSGKKQDVWIEYKWVDKLPKHLVPALSELQLQWGKKRHAEGRKLYVIVGSPEGGVIFNTPYSWEEGQTVIVTYSEEAIASFIALLTTGKMIDAGNKKNVKRGSVRRSSV